MHLETAKISVYQRYMDEKSDELNKFLFKTTPFIFLQIRLSPFSKQ